MPRARGLTATLSKKALAGAAESPRAAKTNRTVNLRYIAHPLYWLSRVATTTGAVLKLSSPVVKSNIDMCTMYMPAGTRSNSSSRPSHDTVVKKPGRVSSKRLSNRVWIRRPSRSKMRILHSPSLPILKRTGNVSAHVGIEGRGLHFQFGGDDHRRAFAEPTGRHGGLLEGRRPVLARLIAAIDTVAAGGGLRPLVLVDAGVGQRTVGNDVGEPVLIIDIRIVLVRRALHGHAGLVEAVAVVAGLLVTEDEDIDVRDQERPPPASGRG